MKSHFIQRVTDRQESLAIQDYCANYFSKDWHHHAELELNVILESSGTAFVGDSIEQFEPGDIVLIGKNLPHLWLNNKNYFQKNSELKAKAHIIHFFEDFAGGLFEIPEMTAIKFLFEQAKLGIKFTEKPNDSITKGIHKIVDGSGVDRIIAFIDILRELSEQKKYKILSNPGYMASVYIEMDKDRLLPVYEYIITNFKNRLYLSVAAELANMEPSSFSRYFARVHKKTFIEFVTEVRIGHVCKLLIDDKPIASACYESGFNNLSNFHRHFKKIKGMSPSEYIQFHSIE